MREKLCAALRLVLFAVIGVSTTDSIFRVCHHHMHPEMYVAQSAPWYLGIEFNAIVAVITVAIILVLMRATKGKS